MRSLVQKCVIVLIGLTAGVAFADYPRSISDDNGNSAEIRKQDEGNSWELWLEGAYNGKKFHIPFKPGQDSGIAYYPEGLAYGKDARHVWMFSYYRYYSGVCLFDVEANDTLFAANGRAPSVSPDGVNCAYAQDGIYGLTYAVCLNDFIVYPVVMQSADFMSRANPEVEKCGEMAPQMELRTPIRWLDKESFGFVIDENPNLAVSSKDKRIVQRYLVRVSGVGEKLTTDSLKVERVKLDDYLVVAGDESLAYYLDVGSLTKEYAQKFQPVTENDWQPDVWKRDAWKAYPDTEGKDAVSSPDGKHILSWGVCREFHDSPFGIQVRLDDKIIVSCQDYKPDTYDTGTSASEEFYNVGAVSRLLSLPVWESATKVRFVVQGNWAAQAVLGDIKPTKYTVFEIDLTKKPFISSREISREEAFQIIGGTADASSDSGEQ